MKKILMLALATLCFPLTVMGSCLPDMKEQADLAELAASEDMFVPWERLRKEFHWDGEEILWRWSDNLSGIEMSGGNVIFLSDGTMDPDKALPLAFGFGGKAFGGVCIGNLQFSGPVELHPEGLRLLKGAKLLYPK